MSWQQEIEQSISINLITESPHSWEKTKQLRATRNAEQSLGSITQPF
jgi:hypothetical protein